MKKLIFGFLCLLFILNGCVVIPKETLDELQKKNIPLAISRLSSTTPNSVGGVDVFIEFKNISNKSFKYITFSFRAYNRVNDPVLCSVRGNSKHSGKITGPIPPSKVQRGIWDNFWYNSTINYIKVEDVIIEFMDGSFQTINKSDMQKALCL